METMIEFLNVSKAFKGFAVKNLSFQVKQGVVTGFVGANGAGKSTTIKLIMNLLKPDSGSVKIFGLDYRKHEKQIKEKIGFVYDDSVFYEHLTLAEMKNMIAPMYKSWDEALFASYVTMFQLPLKKPLKTFSKGMSMKASLAIALSHNAELIIMDEPTAGLDPVFRREFLELLQNIVRDSGKTIFFSTHITSDLDRIAEHIVFIHKGQLQFIDTFAAIEERFVLVKGESRLLNESIKQQFIALHTTATQFEGLSNDKDAVQAYFGDTVAYEAATLEDIMFYTKKGGA